MALSTSRRRRPRRALLGLTLVVAAGASASEKKLRGAQIFHSPEGTTVEKGVNGFAGMIDDGSSPSQYIVNGVQVPPARFGWFAAAMTTNIQFAGCAGSLIAQDWIITAGHCVENGYNGARPPRINHWEVGYMGAACVGTIDNCGQAYVDVRANYTVVHPDYDYSINKIYPDMALVNLADPVPDFIEPVDIDTGRYIPKPPNQLSLPDESRLQGQWMTVIGAGWTQGKNSTSFPDYLQQIDVPHVPRNLCARAYNDNPGSSHWRSEICAGAQNMDSCNGDSGGPLVFNERGGYRNQVLVGTVSFGTPECDGTPPGVYVSIGNQIDWIKSHVCDCNMDPDWCPQCVSAADREDEQQTDNGPSIPDAEEVRTTTGTQLRRRCSAERRRAYKKPPTGKRRKCSQIGKIKNRVKRERVCFSGPNAQTAQNRCRLTCSGACSFIYGKKKATPS